MQRQVSSSLVRLPLAKFSRADDVSPNVSQFSWRHLTQDLVVVFDTFRGLETSYGSPSQMLKVLQGTQLLESVNIAELIGESHQVINAVRHVNVDIKHEQLPISALVRSPLLAIRWKVTNTQLKFATDADFDVAYNHLHTLGLSMAHSGQQANTGNSSFTHNPTEISANRPYTANTAPSSSPLASNSISKMSSPFAHRAQTISHHPQELVQPTRPCSASPTMAFSERGALVGEFWASNKPIVPPDCFQRPDTVSSMLVRPSNAMEGERTSHTGFMTPNPYSQQRESVFLPRRELPFKRSSSPPKSSGSDHVRPQSRASSSSMGPPPLPLPSFAAGARPNSSQASSSPTSLPDSIGHRTGTKRPRSSSSRLSNRLADLPPLPAPTFVNVSGPHANASATPSYRTASEGLRQDTQTYRPQSSPAFNVHPAPVTKPAPSKGTASFDRVIAELSKGGQANATGSLASYAAQSEEERRTALNNFIAQQLEDDSFTTLVEDVSRCWGTFAFMD